MPSGAKFPVDALRYRAEKQGLLAIPGVTGGCKLGGEGDVVDAPSGGETRNRAVVGWRSVPFVRRRGAITPRSVPADEIRGERTFLGCGAAHDGHTANRSGETRQRSDARKARGADRVLSRRLRGEPRPVR